MNNIIECRKSLSNISSNDCWDYSSHYKTLIMKFWAKMGYTSHCIVDSKVIWNYELYWKKVFNSLIMTVNESIGTKGRHLRHYFTFMFGHNISLFDGSPALLRIARHSLISWNFAPFPANNSPYIRYRLLGNQSFVTYSLFCVFVFNFSFSLISVQFLLNSNKLLFEV